MATEPHSSREDYASNGNNGGIEDSSIADARRDIASREEQVARDKKALDLREQSLIAREAAIVAREGALSNDLDNAVGIREANEKLVVAALNAQTMTEAAQKANRLTEEFLAMLAHELRNPLAPICNAVAILKDITGAHAQLPWIHDLMKRQTEHMTRLLDDLLDVARVTTGKINLKRRPVAVREFIEQALEASRPLIDARGQNLTLNLLEQSVYIDGDPARLTQVFSNLLNNASKYTDIGGSIALSIEMHDTTLVFKVTDNGSGIRVDMLPRIFDLFAQADRSLARAQGGLGIGLTVVRGVIEMHGGTVTADSAGPDQGSTFIVTLPLLDGHTDGAAEKERPTAPSRSYQMVIIEDNVDANDTLRTLLQHMGHQVHSAFDGTSGIELVKANGPQIILCDIGMPAMDGYAVVAQLRKELPAPQPAMFALTDYGQPEDRMTALRAGFDGHLVKPVDPEALMRMIAEHSDGLGL